MPAPTPYSVDLKQTFLDKNAVAQYDTQGGLAKFISDILPNVYIFAGFILFLYLVFGGFLIISSAGNAKKAEQGQQALTNAALGFMIIFGSYWIIQIIEIITGVPIL